MVKQLNATLDKIHKDEVDLVQAKANREELKQLDARLNSDNRGNAQKRRVPGRPQDGSKVPCHLGHTGNVRAPSLTCATHVTDTF